MSVPTTSSQPKTQRGGRRMHERGVADPHDVSARASAEAITSMLSTFAYATLILGEHYAEDDAVAALTSMWTGGIGLRSP